MDTRCSDSLSEALRAQEQQGSGQSWVTAEGHIVSNGLVRFYAPENIQAGVLERRGKIEQLGLQERAQKLVVEESENSLKRAEAALDQRRQLLNQLRDQARSAQVRAHELEVAELRLDEKIQRLESKDSALGASLDGLRAELAATESQLLQTASTRELAQQRLTDQQNESEQQRQALESQQTELQQARAELQDVERAVQEALMAIRLSQEQQRAFEERLAQARQRLSEAQSRLAQAETQRKDIQVALDSSALQPLLDQRLSREAAVAEIRERADQLSQAMRQLDEQRVMVEREVAPLRDHLTQIEIDASGLRTSLLQVDEQMTDAQVLLADVAAGIEAAFPDGRYPKPSSLHSEVQRISREIDAMGPVNLAALSELEQATERKQFLDAQSADLNSAVETLEDAIRKIDRETRSLLQDTFDTVNKNFGELFPKLFGGGEAKLVMTGEEILDCGVQVMAQPPGKRNTSIHLLSGGEKALTATALVFALFQLNPAPFCLLDEVDAPLDDPNTERFCNLVRHMSSSTQFIFITHNKIAMEMAQHLMGVTMQEQGVSRVVAVDLDAANSIAQEIA
jgi:chromosome segregation protein